MGAVYDAESWVQSGSGGRPSGLSSDSGMDSDLEAFSQYPFHSNEDWAFDNQPYVVPNLVQ